MNFSIFAARKERVEKVNVLIETIASCGRHFFSMTGMACERPSHFEIDEMNGRLYFWDKRTYEKLPLSHTKSKRWHVNFTEGGTLLYLVECLANYIQIGNPIDVGHFGPWPESCCGGDSWGIS